MPDPSVPGPPSALPVRPFVWRLPLMALLLAGLAGLVHLDRVLRREYRAVAVAQAAQSDALLESALQQRAAALHNLSVLVAGVRRRDDAVARFRLVAPGIRSSTPDVERLYLLDGDGVVLDVLPLPGGSAAGAPALRAGDTLPSAASSAALARARATHLAAVGETTLLADGSLGVLLVDPVLRGDRVGGFVAAALPYDAILGRALAPALSGPFAYRVVDDSGRVIGGGGDYPPKPGRVELRDVTLPSGHHWRLAVAVPRFQPVTSRVLTWLVGLMLLLVVLLLVLREEKRAERFALHSWDLEMLSRDLLDANLRLEERAQQVAEANRAKSHFLANVSHELRTPLNAIVGYNGLALEGVYGDIAQPLRQAHERIRAAADHLLGVVDNVLDLSKIEVGRMQVDAQPTDVVALLDAVATVVEPIASAKGVGVDVVAARDLPEIVTDPRHVRQILLNLAANAIKFTERGSVALVARRDDADPHGRVSLAVVDTGVGIDERDIERIFEEFEQVRPSGRGDSLQRGTGLGLAIARKLARLLGGDVVAQSRLGAGSRFTLTLPVRPPHAESGAASGERVTPEAGAATPAPGDVERAIEPVVEPAPVAAAAARDEAPDEAPDEEGARAARAARAAASGESGALDDASSAG